MCIRDRSQHVDIVTNILASADAQQVSWLSSSQSSSLWLSYLLAHCRNMHGITQHGHHRMLKQLHMLPFPHQLLPKKLVQRISDIFISDIVKLCIRVTSKKDYFRIKMFNKKLATCFRYFKITHLIKMLS